jgi:hypothetical protein
MGFVKFASSVLVLMMAATAAAEWVRIAKCRPGDDQTGRLLLRERDLVAKSKDATMVSQWEMSAQMLEVWWGGRRLTPTVHPPPPPPPVSRYR